MLGLLGFGSFRTYAIIAASAMWVFSLGAASLKAYKFGYNNAEVQCVKAKDALKKQITDANDKVSRAVAEWQAKYDTLANESLQQSMVFDTMEADLQRKLKEYEQEISSAGQTVVRRCDPLTVDDIKRLRN